MYDRFAHPLTQENFINETTSILKDYDESLKWQREDDMFQVKLSLNSKLNRKQI